MHADSSAARLGWPGAQGQSWRWATDRLSEVWRCFSGPGAFEGGRTKIERGRTSNEEGRCATVCRFS